MTFRGTVAKAGLAHRPESPLGGLFRVHGKGAPPELLKPKWKDYTGMRGLSVPTLERGIRMVE